MIATKQQKEDMFISNKRYLHLILQEFLKRRPTFYYMYDDLYQEASLKFLLIVDKYRDDKGCKFSTFLHEQVRFYLMNAVSKEIRYKMGEQKYLKSVKITEGYNPYEFDDVLRGAILTDYQKDIVKIRYLCDMTFEEIAMEYGVSKQAISRTERRAVETLKRESI